jgi:UDP-2,3-diacylglucosamine hydrolase
MQRSRFLPENYQDGDRVAVLAGRGDYPVVMVEHMRLAGTPMCLLAFEGETSDALYQQFPASDRCRLKVGQVGKALDLLVRMRAKWAILVGQIRPGRLFNGLHPDLKAVSILARLRERNAETIYGAIVQEMNAVGVQVLDGRSFIDDQLATPGVMTGGRNRVEPSVIEHGIRIANEIARLDIGQGVVVKNGTTLCVEEYDGTDSMLRRAAKFDTDGKLFVKTVKPRQNFTIDVPVFGLTTLESMKEGGIDTAALAADQTIILRKNQVIAKAKEMGIQLVGF